MKRTVNRKTDDKNLGYSKLVVQNSEFPPRSGQLLIEMMVALGILTIGFLGVTALLSRAIGLSRSVSDNYTATYLAEEGIEIAKNVLDANRQSGIAWNDGFGAGDVYAVDASIPVDTTKPPKGLLLPATDATLSIDASNNYTYGGTIPTRFKREVDISRGSSDMEVVVHSIVSWTTSGAGSFSVNLEDHFYNWK